jgi:preprotein translocase subunit SecF
MTTTVTPAPSQKQPSVWHRLYHGETTFDFVGRRRIFFLISLTLIVISIVSLAFRGLNLGIDFEGGVAWEVSASKVKQSDAEDILRAAGINLNDAKIQTLSSASGERLRIQVGTEPNDVQSKVRQELATKAGVDLQEVSLNSVSATWGSEITDKAIRALIAFFVVIAIYISIRFEWKMAVGALAAVVHDVLISVGVYSVFGFEVTPATVIAFLTILGFSLYDTVVVFDKVHENAKRLGTRYPYSDVVNLSMNQVLMRSLNTSLAAVLPVLSLLIVGSWMLGAVALQDFALALLVGLITGSYSSIFIATPILAALKEREPKYRAVRQRAERQGTRSSTTTRLAKEERVALAVNADADTGFDEHLDADGNVVPDAGSKRRATVGNGSGNGAATSAASSGPVQAAPRPSTGLSHPPRPRKKKRR